MLSGSVSKYLWDTRVRNEDVAAILKKLISKGGSFLDAGCGENAIASFFSLGQVVGVDINVPTREQNSSMFVRGSIVALPFDDRSFEYAGSVDVLEHLPVEIREIAIGELCRVARSGIVLAFPFHGEPEILDTQYRDNLAAREKEIPDWLDEHLRQQYPDISNIQQFIEAEISRSGGSAKIDLFYSELFTITRFLRWSSTRSSAMYLASNLFFGVFRPLFFRRLNRSNSYRAVLIATFSGRVSS